MTSVDKILLYTYTAWASFVVLVTFMREGLSANNFTRLLIIAYLLITLAWYWWTKGRITSQKGWAFVLKCSLSALVVEFFYMFSRPVFDSLLVTRESSAQQLLQNSLIDFVFTFPAYLVIFSLFWFLISRFHYRIGEYVLLFSFGQAMGDGNAFFLANPTMLLFAPYVVLNYQAINIVPYLRVRHSLKPSHSSKVLKYILPLILIPGAYWIMGAMIIVVGRAVGLAK